MSDEHDEPQDADGRPRTGAELDRETGEAASAPAAQPRESGRDTSA